jgi:hypothetical protein
MPRRERHFKWKKMAPETLVGMRLPDMEHKQVLLAKQVSTKTATNLKPTDVCFCSALQVKAMSQLL